MVCNLQFTISINGDTEKTIFLDNLKYRRSDLTVVDDIILKINQQLAIEGIFSYIQALKGKSSNSIMFTSEDAVTVTIGHDSISSDFNEDLTERLIIAKTTYTKPEFKTLIRLVDPVNVGDVVVIKSGLTMGQHIVDEAIEEKHLSEELKIELGIN